MAGGVLETQRETYPGVEAFPSRHFGKGCPLPQAPKLFAARALWPSPDCPHCPLCSLQALALIELYNAPEGRYKQDVYLLPKKMGE